MSRLSGRNLKSKKFKVESDADEAISQNVRDVSKETDDCGSTVKRTATGRTAEAKRHQVPSVTPDQIQTTNPPNPLKNPVILNHLFGLSPPDVLAKCRRVCKQWYNESLVTWRTTFPITLTVERGSIFLTNRYQKSRPLYTPLKRFLKYIETPSNQCSTKPYRNIKIVDCELTYAYEAFEEFWSAMADNVTTLELRNCSFSDTHGFRQIIFQRCPNLKHLIITECLFPDMWVPVMMVGGKAVEYEPPFYGEHKHLKTLKIYKKLKHKIPISWLDIFSHFQSLTSFVFHLHRGRNFFQDVNKFHEFDSLAEAIRIVRKEGQNKLPFKFFQISPPFILSQDSFDQRNLAMACELCLPLTGLVINVHPQLDQDFAKHTLNIYATKLNSIGIYQEAPNLLFPEFPFENQWNNLAQLFIEDKLCKDFTFLKHVPNLESLAIAVDEDLKEIGEYRYETPSSAVRNTPKEELEHVRMEQLKELHFGCVVSDDDISRLSQWMPEVVTLKMILTDKQFGIVCEKWKDLKKMKVLGDKLTDGGITGRGIVQGRRRGKSDVVLPNITYLQQLEKFTFCSWSLTADSVFHGFLELPNLQKIKSESPKMVWDKASRTALMKKKIELS